MSSHHLRLRNHGASCYLNAALQTLFMTEDFRKAVERLENPEKSSVSYELQQLFLELKAGNRNASTEGIIRALHTGNVCEQQDAAEYLHKILEFVTPGLSKIFQGEETHYTTCLGRCKQSREESVPFFFISIKLTADQHDVKRSLDDYFSTEKIDGEDQLYCPNCENNTDHEMRCELSEFPEILVLHLKRFYLDYNFMTYKKNDCRVNIPYSLPCEQVCKGSKELQASVSSNKEHTYDLYAVVEHVGSLSGGHYYVSIKSFEDGRWHEFNDSAVYPEPTIARLPGSPGEMSDSVCMLLYKKMKPDLFDAKAGPQRRTGGKRAAETSSREEPAVEIKRNVYLSSLKENGGGNGERGERESENGEKEEARVRVGMETENPFSRSTERNRSLFLRVCTVVGAVVGVVVGAVLGVLFVLLVWSASV